MGQRGRPRKVVEQPQVQPGAQAEAETCPKPSSCLKISSLSKKMDSSSQTWASIVHGANNINGQNDIEAGSMTGELKKASEHPQGLDPNNIGCSNLPKCCPLQQQACVDQSPLNTISNNSSSPQIVKIDFCDIEDELRY